MHSPQNAPKNTRAVEATQLVYAKQRKAYISSQPLTTVHIISISSQQKLTQPIKNKSQGFTESNITTSTMASSSSRSTFTELTIVHYYRIAFTRLWSAGLHSQAEFITTKFAEVLDIEVQQLTGVLKPIYEPSRGSRASWLADIKQWNELQASNLKLRRSPKIYAAGNALADVGAELFRTGRKDEGERFCEYGEAVWGWSVNEFEKEEAWKNGGADWDMELDS